MLEVEITISKEYLDIIKDKEGWEKTEEGSYSFFTTDYSSESILTKLGVEKKFYSCTELNDYFVLIKEGTVVGELVNMGINRFL